MSSNNLLTKYSIPFNGDLSLMEEAFKTGKIYEVYFAAPKKYDRGFVYSTEYEKFTEEKIAKLLKLARKYKIRTNLIFNSPLFSFRDIEKEIDYIHSIKNFLNSITLSDPYQISKFKKKFPNLKIEASVIMNLDSHSKIEKMIKQGVHIVNIPLDLNRKLGELKKIAKLKQHYPEFKIKLLVNHICFYGCPFMAFHYFFSEIKEVFKLKLNINIDFNKCMFPSSNLEELIKRPFIRPEDINFYKKNNYADIFKICFRTDKSSVLRKTIFAYLKESYRENLLDIITTHGKPLHLYWDNRSFPKDFIETVANCDKLQCRKCKYCQKVSKKVFKKLQYG